MNSSKQYPCPRCGYFRGRGGIVCAKCGRDTNAPPTPPLPVPRNDSRSNYTPSVAYGDAMSSLMPEMLLLLIGYPIGFLTLKLFTLGRIRLGSWSNFGGAFRLSYSRIFRLTAHPDGVRKLSTEAVAVFGWNLAALTAFAIVIVSKLG